MLMVKVIAFKIYIWERDSEEKVSWNLIGRGRGSLFGCSVPESAGYDLWQWANNSPLLSSFHLPSTFLLPSSMGVTRQPFDANSVTPQGSASMKVFPQNGPKYRLVPFLKGTVFISSDCFSSRHITSRALRITSSRIKRLPSPFEGSLSGEAIFPEIASLRRKRLVTVTLIINKKHANPGALFLWPIPINVGIEVSVSVLKAKTAKRTKNVLTSIFQYVPATWIIGTVHQCILVTIVLKITLFIYGNPFHPLSWRFRFCYLFPA